jgi:hypothetical protein
MHMKITDYTDWSGNADDMAELAARLTSQDPKFRDQLSPNTRLIRDYVQRGIVNAPERRGKEAIFSYRHLVQFLAARALLANNWPLRKIAETLPHMGEEKLASILGGASQIESLDTSADDDDYPVGGLVAGMSTTFRPTFEIRKEERISELDRLYDRFQERTEDVLQKRSELQTFRSVYGIEGDDVEPDLWSHFEINAFVEMHIRTDELEGMSFDEAELIGRAVTATLYRHLAKETD